MKQRRRLQILDFKPPWRDASMSTNLRTKSTSMKRNALLVALASAAMAADWTQFRGPASSAISAEKGLPLKWSASDNIRWKVDLPGRGASCPIIAHGKIYLTACTGYRQKWLHVLCFDQA